MLTLVSVMLIVSVAVFATWLIDRWESEYQKKWNRDE